MTLGVNQINNSNTNANINFCKNYRKFKRRPLVGHALRRDFVPQQQKKKNGFFDAIKAICISIKNTIAETI